MKRLEWRQRKAIYNYSPFDDLYEKLAAINGIDDIEHFLNPTERDLHDPSLLKNIKEAVNRIEEAIHNDEKISIFADVDADGICSAAIMYNFLKKYTDNIVYFHGQRNMGHGIHTKINDIPEGTELLIIVDSSSSEWKECKELCERGISTIIIDHHEIKNPNYYCTLVNPQQEGCKYPNKSISGGALTWQVCRYMSKGLSMPYVDLSAISLISDIMSMREQENRAIVTLGLNNIKNKGILTLLKHKNKNPNYVNTTDIAYNVTTFLNAAARLNEIELAIELLISDDEERCKKLVKEIDKLNTKRKKTQSVHIEDFKTRINESDKIIVLVELSINKSFSGLIAQQIAQEYQRPCLILSHEKGKDVYSGSYRSYGGFNIKEYFESLPEAYMVGGHAGAGGVSVKTEMLEQFLKSVQDNAKDLAFEQVIEYDLELDANEIDEDFIKQVNSFYRISGNEFPEAKFLVNGLYVEDKAMLGKTVKETVKIDCGDLQLMKFKTNEDFFKNVPIYSSVSAVGTLNINSYYNFGKKKLIKANQLFLEDIRIG